MSHTESQLLAANLRGYRTRNGLSQTKLAEQTDMPQSTIAALESGTNRNVGLKYLIKLAHGMDMDMTELFDPNMMACGATAGEIEALLIILRSPKTGPEWLDGFLRNYGLNQDINKAIKVANNEVNRVHKRVEGRSTVNSGGAKG